MTAHAKTIGGALILASALMLCAPVMALEGDLSAEPAAQSPASGQVADNNVPVFSGGIGDDEIAYIKSVQHQYDAKFLFTATNGEFLADLPVNIRNKQGDTVVSTVTNGPVLLVNLPAGSYTVTASQDGVSKEQKISVAANKLQTFQFRFPVQGDLVSSNNN